MKINYCLPIIKPTVSEVRKQIEENNAEYQYFEVWLDYLEDVDIQSVEDLKEKLGERVIFLFRRQNLEQIKMSFEKRKEIINSLESSESFLDIDMETQKEDLEYIKGKKIKIILSYHNYKETPEEEMLEGIIKKMQEYSPAIYKFSTFCQSEEDALRLLKLLLGLKQRDLPYIILGMGEKGTITRVFGTLWGNKMTFAPKNEEEKSAPGQLTRVQLEKIFEEIN